MDGTMRDGPAILQLGLPIFCSGLVPRGPVKEYGGFIDVPVGIGALSISPGDLIIGDMDGVTVVPLIHEAAVFKRCQDQLALEEKRVAAIEEGGIIAKLFDVRKAEPLE
jgi:regulator of RNase E activity RraA